MRALFIASYALAPAVLLGTLSYFRLRAPPMPVLREPLALARSAQVELAAAVEVRRRHRRLPASGWLEFNVLSRLKRQGLVGLRYLDRDGDILYCDTPECERERKCLRGDCAPAESQPPEAEVEAWGRRELVVRKRRSSFASWDVCVPLFHQGRFEGLLSFSVF